MNYNGYKFDFECDPVIKNSIDLGGGGGEGGSNDQ